MTTLGPNAPKRPTPLWPPRPSSTPHPITRSATHTSLLDLTSFAPYQVCLNLQVRLSSCPTPQRFWPQRLDLAFTRPIQPQHPRMAVQAQRISRSRSIRFPRVRMAYWLFVHNKLSSVIPQESRLQPVQPTDHRRLSVSRVQAGSYMRSVFVQSSRLHVAHLPTSNRLWSLGQTRVLMDLSFPPGQSVNSGIPSDTYLGEPFTLRLPGIDALLALICTKGPGCHIFKKDLSQAYRQH